LLAQLCGQANENLRDVSSLLAVKSQNYSQFVEVREAAEKQAQR